MGNIQLIIDNQIADVYNSGDLLTSVTYSIGSINDIEKRENASSKTIKIPATNNNKKIFGFADDLAVTSFKGQKSYMIGRIREAGTDILVGLVNLKTVQRIGIDCYFEITIIGNCGEWIDQMTSQDLRTLGSDGTHLKTLANITAAQSGLLEYAYGLVNNGFQGWSVKIGSVEDDGQGHCQFMVDGTNGIWNLRSPLSDYNCIGVLFSNPIYNKNLAIATNSQFDRLFSSIPFGGDSTGVIRMLKSDVRIEDRPLMINVEKAFTKCFALAGYRIRSTFCSSDFFKKLFILPGSEKQKEDFVSLNSVSAGITTTITRTAITTTGTFPFNVVLSGNPLNYNLAYYRFVAPAGCLVNFKVSFNIKGTDDYQAYARFLVNGVAVTSERTNKTRTPVTLSSTEFNVLMQEAELRLAAGEYVTVEIIIPSIGGEMANIEISPLLTTLECNVTTAIVANSTVVPFEQLPDIKRIDFIKAIRHLFNLYFFTDVAMKTVYIEPRDTFYRRDKYIDLTDKLDISQLLTYEELGADVSKTLSFKYKDDTTDYALTEYKRIHGDEFSKYPIDLDNRFSPIEEKAIENPLFAPTIMATFDSAGLTKSLLPKIWATPADGDTLPEKLTDFLPRILYYAGMRDIKTGEGWNFEGTAQTEYPLFCSFDGDSVNDDSLLFYPQPIIPDLFFKHYANYVRTLNEGRKITGYFNLNAGDIQSLTVPDNAGNIIKDFRSLVFFRHKGEVHHCRLESINDYTAGKNQSTKVILVTDVDNISQQVSPFINSMEFTNDTPALGASYANGSIVRSATLWNDCRNGTSGNIIVQGLTYGAGSAGIIPYKIERLFLFFDTSNLPDAAVITEAYLDIYKISGDVSQEIKVFLGTQSNILTLADYDNFGSDEFGASHPGNLGLRRIYLSIAGRNNISKTGVTKFCLREAHFDVDNYTPSANYQSFKTYLRNSPANYLNKLTVKYTL